MTERYPVYLILASAAYRFDGPEDVDRFLARLKMHVAQYELSHRSAKSRTAL
jgi:hypothetical protein